MKKEVDDMAAKWMMSLIKGYKRWISPLKGKTCRFYPTCSSYSLTAYERFGFFKGSWLTLKRIVKCQPFHPGGVDHVPDKNNH